ncbi:long-chain-fatty-acid--CoA ligase [Ruegeria sp.]|uniref:class I adenylate-forming enzyme family protein n=1 Tax=Ruegeria sp. TaxID=1879320 RepID=UPI0023280D92|nr:long-chain-fatty-acid--CoA ligase [Ruegeria sp.]MDA7966040.1 long-chain-fatty-acid--CoA ligase [Ruegeria sp.]
MIEHLGQISARAAAQFGTKTALITDEKRVTFTEIDRLACQLAGGLASMGVGKGDIVTLYSANCWEWVVSYYGVTKLGAVINPINVMLTPEEVRYVVQDCGAKMIIASPEKGAPLAGIENDSDVKSVIVFGDEAPEGMMSFDALLAADHPCPEVPDVDPESLSTICYTSGTTGRPKGAMQSHRAVILNTSMTAQMHLRTADDVVVSALPCPHVYGNVVMNSVFFLGGTLNLHALFDPGAALAAIAEYKATLFEGVPTMYMYMLEHPDLPTTDLSSLRCCTVGGQTMPTAKMEAVEESFGCPLIELWGMTEIAGLGSTHPIYGPNKMGSIGVALPYCELRIADNENYQKALPHGEVGELMVRGPIVMIGYFNDPERTAEALEDDGWLHTGDLAKMDSDGCVYVVDRKKDMILTAGYNVYPAEIERVLAQHPAVAISAVGPVPDEQKGEIAKAYVVLKDGANAEADEIIAFCRETLAAYKVPRAVRFVDDLPKTSTGKIMRRELKTLDV